MAVTSALLFTPTNDISVTAAIIDYKNKSNLMQYKNGGSVRTKSLAILGDFGDCILTADKVKPLLHLWPVNSLEEDKKARLFLPDPANSLCVSADDNYLAAGIGAKLYLWQLNSGKLLTVQEKHYQPISCIRMQEDYVLVAGEDGILVGYSLTDLLCGFNAIVEPLYSKHEHTRAITDVYVNNFGFTSRFVTVSRDDTARLYELGTGQILLRIAYAESLTCVAANLDFRALYFGTTSGQIIAADLTAPSRSLDHDVGFSDTQRFVGHTKCIYSLAVYQNSTCLASAAADCKIIIWNIKSRLILTTIEREATNIAFISYTENFKNHSFKQAVIINSLEKQIVKDKYYIIPRVMQTDSVLKRPTATAVDNRSEKLELELNETRALNNQLYSHILDLLTAQNVKL